MMLETPASPSPARERGPQLILWIGPKHSGKTTSAQRLVATALANDFVVAGFVAPSLYENGELVGFDILELDTRQRTPLARRREGRCGAGRFAFLPKGMKAGRDCLYRAATGRSDIVVVDEYGPLEMAHRGWRNAVDRLLISTDAPVLLVVREQLADRVRDVYGKTSCRKLIAHEPESANTVLTLLRTGQNQATRRATANAVNLSPPTP